MTQILIPDCSDNFLGRQYSNITIYRMTPNGVIGTERARPLSILAPFCLDSFMSYKVLFCLGSFLPRLLPILAPFCLVSFLPRLLSILASFCLDYFLSWLLSALIPFLFFSVLVPFFLYYF